MELEAISLAKKRLLELIKRTGPCSAVALSATLRLTDVAVRQHLNALETAGLVQQNPTPATGRGRPSVHWTLSKAAEGLFPDRHADLTVGLIEALREVGGEDVLQSVLAQRAQIQIQQYKKALPKKATLRKQVEALASFRSQEGYMAEVKKDGSNTFLLIEHHCPICDAARCCLGLCESELEVFQKTLGKNIQVERKEHMLSGGERCVYEIRKA